ncbi:type 4 pilus major pilin [Janthinobacterium sp. 17J80-10]|uniref:type 4 pilus major pilin n=1 Tax=Janthinobacterium sp. 17J80-10 TaxID=2497863 RepID=UPI00100568E9|nr:type 4 pilus major pilin [Janthinobacterium sp. 17J80-10]QAU35247.1 prepilin-type N-terminal cleavage/methylation domain-containing protein [Janthinobacterium sp. 17J80-10]
MKALNINTRNKINTLKQQAGMTLTESLLVLSVGALVAVLAYGGYKMATNDVKTQSQAKGTVQLVGKIKQVFGTSASYGTASASMYTTVKNAKILPADFKDNGTAFVNAWGGTVVPAVGANTAQFTITFNGVPADGCIEFLNGVNSAASSGLTMGGTSVKTAAGDFDTAAAATQCAASTSATAATQVAVLTAQ